MTPISRFGVGLLCCFEVANSIEIQTCTDPKFGASTPLDIVIEGRGSQFRVVENKSNRNVGTSITIHIDESLWDTRDRSRAPLTITEYIKEVVGYQEYPILVVEHGTQTLIVPTTATQSAIDALRRRFPDVNLIRYSLPIDSDVFYSEDVGFTSTVFERRVMEFNRKVGGLQIQGQILHYVPKDNVAFSSTLRGQTPGYTGKLVFLQSKNSQYSGGRVRAKLTHGQKAAGLVPSISKFPGCDAFLQGIRLPDVDIKVGKQNSTPPPQVLVNITSAGEMIAPVLSRRATKTPLPDLQSIILDEINKDVSRQFGSQFESASLPDRLSLIGRLETYYDAEVDSCFDASEWPIPHIGSNGKIQFHRLKDVGNEIECNPNDSVTQFAFSQGVFWPPQGWFSSFTFPNEFWPQSRTLCVDTIGHTSDQCPDEWKAMFQSVKRILGKFYRQTGVRLIRTAAANYIAKICSKINVDSIAVEEASGETPVFWFSKVRFYHFDENSSDLVGLLPIGRPNNMLHSLMLNADHVIGQLFKRALCSHGKLIDGHAKDTLDDVFFGFDLMRYGYTDYKSNRFELETPPWIVRYCRTSAHLEVINLSRKEDDALNAAMSILQARE